MKASLQQLMKRFLAMARTLHMCSRVLHGLAQISRRPGKRADETLRIAVYITQFETVQLHKQSACVEHDQ
eukprot:5473304-Amphidinium_carterae.1